MRRFWILIAITITLVVCGVYGQELQTSEGLDALIRDAGERPYFLVDVRTPEEFQRGHIPTATNIPVTEIGLNPPTEDTEALVIVYCASGVRSDRAKRALEKAGYNNVINFGGIGNWRGEIVVPSE